MDSSDVRAGLPSKCNVETDLLQFLAGLGVTDVESAAASFVFDDVRGFSKIFNDFVVQIQQC